MAEVGSAFVSVLPSARGFGSSLDKQVSRDVTASGKRAGGTWGKIFKITAGLAIGAKAISFLGDSLSEGREAEKVAALTEQRIKTMGNVAGISAKGVASLAESISKKTGIDDEQIQASENLLLSFSNIKNEGKGLEAIFNRATQASVDLSAGGFGSMDSTAKQLGKALQDPVKGITALGRSGVTFTEKQKATIKKLVETGDVLGAQKIILGEVEKQVKGSAEAQASAADKAKVAYGNLKEQIGTALLPVVDKLANWFTTKVAPAVTQFIDQMQSGKGAGGQFADALSKIKDGAQKAYGVLKTVFTFLIDNKEGVATFIAVLGGFKILHSITLGFKALSLAMSASPIGLVVLAVAALAAGLVIAYKKSETFRNVVDTAFRVVAAAGRWLWNNVLQPVFKFIVKGIGWVIEGFADMLGALSHVPGFGWAKDAADKMHGAADQAKNMADKIRDIPASKTVNVQVMVNTSAIAKAEAQLDRFTAHAANQFPRSPVKEGPLRAFNKYGGLGGALMHNLERGIADRTPRTRKALGAALDRLKDRLTGFLDEAKSLAKSVADTFKQDIFAGSLTDFFVTGSQNVANLTAMKAALKTLKGFGASDSFVKALFSKGNVGLISQLAGSDAATVKQAQSLFNSQNTLGSQLGNAVGTTVLGDEMREVRKEIRALRKDVRNAGKENAREFGRELNRTAGNAARGGRQPAWA